MCFLGKLNRIWSHQIIPHYLSLLFKKQEQLGKKITAREKHTKFTFFREEEWGERSLEAKRKAPRLRASGHLSLSDAPSVLGPQKATAQEALEEEQRIACYDSISNCLACKKLCPQHRPCCSGLCRPVSRQWSLVFWDALPRPPADNVYKPWQGLIDLTMGLCNINTPLFYKRICPTPPRSSKNRLGELQCAHATQGETASFLWSNISINFMQGTEWHFQLRAMCNYDSGNHDSKTEQNSELWIS